MIFICPWTGNMIPDECMECITKSKSIIESVGHIFDLRILSTDKKDPSLCAIEKDNYALNILSTLSQVAIFDADIEIFYIPECNVASNPLAIFESGTPRIGYIISNNMEFFQKIVSEKLRRGIKDVYGFPNKLFRGKTFDMIPNDSYIHHRYTSKGGNNARF